ncbi:hypothetical protein BJ684DRAFT_8820 [Piptocephalis cylindrospora]|uniref:Dcp1-like decapping n=1 Tax=Piptocephalis cylindrospora TaxID=1907219 RepID=A0A4P9Y692_9FUNG|nr:hypothetical protein BJ684DRAFT_8820 [Piptocephalis cylindrospora]|eukprot:RKP14292.1 hypothetical protein BJ684DRAFT_8820 [Piptocephalis cylindrospora]
MNADARVALNLRVLKRHDKCIRRIVDSTSFAVVYTFSRETKEWTKAGVEGTLFLVERSVSPLYGFFIMNRLGLENFSASLNRSMEIILTPEFVIYQNDTGKVYGLWAYEATDRERIGNMLIE